MNEEYRRGVQEALKEVAILRLAPNNQLTRYLGNMDGEQIRCVRAGLLLAEAKIKERGSLT